MNQISLFDGEAESTEGILISPEVVSPLESKEKLNSLAFKQEQRVWSKYLKAIASYHGCSVFKARELLIEARDNQTRILVDFDKLF